MNENNTTQFLKRNAPKVVHHSGGILVASAVTVLGAGAVIWLVRAAVLVIAGN